MDGDEAIRMAENVLTEFENKQRAKAGVAPKYRPHSVRYDMAMSMATKDLDRRRNGEIVGLPWPVEWPALSRRIGPIEPSSLTIVAARPSVGKSLFAMQLARFLASRGKCVLFVSRELSVVRLLRRSWAAYGANMMSLRKGEPTDRDIDAIATHSGEAMGWNLYIDDISTSVAEIDREAEALKPDLIIIDYLQRLAYDTEKEYAAITRLVNELQDLTLETGIPVVCLSQLSRPLKGNEWKPPSMSDTRGSGAVEERAANLILLHRHWDTSEEEAYGKTVKVAKCQSEDGYFIVAKCSDGETGTPIHVLYEGAKMKVTEKIAGLS